MSRTAQSARVMQSSLADLAAAMTVNALQLELLERHQKRQAESFARIDALLGRTNHA